VLYLRFQVHVTWTQVAFLLLEPAERVGP
jgi:hypothetical protein